MTRPAPLDVLRDKIEAESRRAIRIETRLVRLMEHLGLDPNGSVSVPNTPFSEIHHGHYDLS